jgi:glyoxylase-like metal-dependent hydrolase (beta-lactamase superfamily II)
MKVWQTKSGYSVSNILPGRSNVFLLSGNGKYILIDGSPGYKWEKLKASLTNLGIRKIDFLILTHTHYDHAENASKIKEEYGAVVIVNKREADYLQKGENIVPHGTIFLTRFIINKISPAFSDKLNYEPCQPDILVDQLLDLHVFGFNAHIMHTPGHSPGSQSVIVDDEIAIVGDSMFGIFPQSIFPPFAFNEYELIKSWGKLLETDCYTFLPSHGTPNSRELLAKEFKKRSRSLSL